MPRDFNGYDGPQRAYCDYDEHLYLDSPLFAIRDPTMSVVCWTVFRRRQTSRIYFREGAIRLQHAGRSAVAAAHHPNTLTHPQPVSLSTPNGDHALAETRHLVHVNEFRRFRTPSQPKP